MPTAAPRVASTCAASSTVALNYREHRLQNGLRVILHRDPRVPRVALNLLYRVGSRDDPPGRSGLAHLLEHLMFMGTRRAPEGVFDGLMEQVGGWSNAYTAEDVTVYYNVGPARLLETLLWLEADRMTGVGPALTRDKLALQRDVVLNELRQDYFNVPYGAVELAQPGLLFPPRHPYARPVIGSERDLKAVTVGDVRRMLSRSYSPSNASLVVAGDIELERTLALVERYLGWIPAGGGREPQPIRRAPRRQRQRRRRFHDAVASPKLMLAYNSPAHMQPGDAEMDLLADLLASGKRSRLHRELVHRRRLALRVEAYQLSRPLGSVFGVGLTVRPGQDPARAEGALRELLARVMRRPCSRRELRSVTLATEADLLLGLQQLHRRAELLNAYAEALGTPGGLGVDLERYRQVSPARLQQVAASVLGRPDVCCWVLPRPGAAREES